MDRTIRASTACCTQWPVLTAWNRRSLRSEQLAFRLSPHPPRRRRRNPEVQRRPPKDDVVFNAVATPGAMWRWTNTDSWTRVTAACRRLARLGATDVGNLGLSQLAPKKKSLIKHRNFLGQQNCVSQLAPFLFLEKSCIFCIMELPNTLFLVVTVIFMLLSFSSRFFSHCLPSSVVVLFDLSVVAGGRLCYGRLRCRVAAVTVTCCYCCRVLLSLS